jgi:hypothetical protein
MTWTNLRFGTAAAAQCPHHPEGQLQLRVGGKTGPTRRLKSAQDEHEAHSLHRPWGQTLTPGRSCPPGVNFVPMGWIYPLEVKISVRPSIILKRSCLGANKRVNISPREQISPLGAKITSRGEVKNGPQEILWLVNLQPQRQRFSRQARAFLKRKKIILKTRDAIGCDARFYNAGVVNRGRRIGSRSLDVWSVLRVRQKLNARRIIS